MVIHNRYLSSPDIPGYSFGSILSPCVLHTPVINWDGKKMKTEWSLRLRWDGLGSLLEELQLSRSSSHWLYVVTRKGGLLHTTEYGFMVYTWIKESDLLKLEWHGCGPPDMGTGELTSGPLDELEAFSTADPSIQPWDPKLFYLLVIQCTFTQGWLCVKNIVMSCGKMRGKHSFSCSL